MEKEIVLVPNQCRSCTKYIMANKKIDLFAKNNENLIKKIKDLTGIMLDMTCFLPRFICIECKMDLENAYAFRQRFFDAQNFFFSTKKDILEDPIGTNEHKPDSIFKELSVNENDVKEEIPPNLSEVNEFQLNAKRRLKQLNSSKKLVKSLSKHKRLICDQCGSGFSTKQNFDLHWRRHFNHRPYECELCPEKYFIAADLKRHMRLHTGEKPYSCRYCERRFVDSSSRIRHERCSHTNLRPFQCALCDKAFTNSYILKNHMLTHTKERTFECKLCNKMFLRKSHLVTHYSSTTHKDNLKK